MPSPNRQYPARKLPRALAALAALALTAAPVSAQRMALLATFPIPRRDEARDIVDVLRSRNLLLPVEGLTAGQLHDTYNDARSGGRVHDAIDIHAPRGTHVLATTDGTIIKLHHSSLGGITIYQLDDDGRTRYYYAHLDRYADGIAEGVRVTRGQTIGYVGDTGNAAPGDTHLHFAIAILSDASRWWAGRNVNPYDVFHGR
ncbi:M23 family metallopeptidase [Longimicrobium sp.]|uniref:M23 family metallopeptidase n=1 Tax=Longimicrobium sp. TaxID=2029185 RepID=UPI002D0D5B67|nr:M23 family metallopeptidase [Longimicrobium sp.]HSU17745.1 M23 family metallopeptidase [Longimicrobium sp.]